MSFQSNKNSQSKSGQPNKVTVSVSLELPLLKLDWQLVIKNKSLGGLLSVAPTLIDRLDADFPLNDQYLEERMPSAAR